MDPLLEEELMAEEEAVAPTGFMDWVVSYLAQSGWQLVLSVAVAVLVAHRAWPSLLKWGRDRSDATYNQSPDEALARMEALQRARDAQQQRLAEASQRALQLQQEREERRRAEAAARLEKYGAAAGGQRLGDRADDYMPLSAGASTSSYRPPKKSKCGGGGCGR